MLWSLLLGSVLVLAAVAAHQLRNKHVILRRGERLHCPADTLPVLGNAIRFLQPRHLLFDWFVKCQATFGLETYEISVPTLPSGVVIQSPQNLEYVLKNEDKITKGEFFRKRSWDLFGHGIINANGDLWRTQRKAGLKFFSGPSLGNLIEVVLPKVYAGTRHDLRTLASSNAAFDLQEVFLGLTTTAVGRIAYNMDIDTKSPFSKAFDYASDHVGLRFQNQLYTITELFFGSRFRSALAEVKQFGHTIVANARHRRMIKARKMNLPQDDSVHGDLIDSLMNAFDDPSIVADAALNFLSAGRDTTAQSLTWTCYLLMRHPRTVDQIREEIINTFTDRDLSTLTVADLQPSHIPYTMAVIYESLRLYPPVPFEVKQCEMDVVLPDGTSLPASSIVVWCIWAMNRSKEIWGATGSDLETFDPQRWLEDGKILTKSAFDFPVFNGGPRACLGKKMAELMGAYLIINLVSELDFEEIAEGRYPGQERKSQNSLTLPMQGGLPCRVTFAKTSQNAGGV